MVGEIRSGATIRAAVTEAASENEHIAAGLVHVRRLLDRGSSIGDACRAVADDPSLRRTIPEFASALTVIAEAAEAGGGAGLPIERVAAAARQRAADELDRAAHSAQARLSAHVLTLVPIAVCVVLVLGDRRVIAVVSSASGIAVVALGLALNGAGWLWMQAIIRRGDR